MKIYRKKMSRPFFVKNKVVSAGPPLMGEPEGARRATGGSPISGAARYKVAFVPVYSVVPDKPLIPRFSTICEFPVL